MIKLIWISDTEIKGIAFWFLRKVSDSKDYNDIKGEEAEEIIEDESTDFLYLNIKRPANTDIMNRLCLRNITRLRVSVFKLKPVKSRILKFLFPPEIIKTIAQNIFISSESSSKYISSH
ncbi:MAG: hypothetical protein Q7S39_08365 [Ignavibacteria bacterium]|nr:hypothetical protein [Ignavibacteria bacterium]